MKVNDIPKNIDEVFLYLDTHLPGTDKLAIASLHEKELSNLHHTLGQWMRNKWQLWHGSVLKTEMERLGFYHPDDMSQALIVAYYCKLNDQVFDIKKFAKNCLDFYINDISIKDLMS